MSGDFDLNAMVPRQALRDAKAENERLRKAYDRLETALAHVINRVSTECRDDEHGHIFLVGQEALRWARIGLDAIPGKSEQQR